MYNVQQFKQGIDILRQLTGSQHQAALNTQCRRPHLPCICSDSSFMLRCRALDIGGVHGLPHKCCQVAATALA